jgi:integrase
MNAISQTIAAQRQPEIITRLDLTFADLITLIETSDTLTEDQKRIWSSDLRTTAAMLGLSPAAVPCDVIWLNQHVFRKLCTDFGKSYDRFRNIKLSDRKALEFIGLRQPRICGEAGLSPAWIEVLDAALVVPQRAGLRRMARFCAIRFIEPDQLTNPVFVDFLAEEVITRLDGKASKRGPTIARAWNRIIASSPALRRCQPLQAPPQREPYTLPIDRFSASLQAEYAAYREWTSPSQGRSHFKGRRGKRRGRPATLKTRSFSVLQMLGALVRMGHDPAAITGFDYIIRYGSDILEFFEARAIARLPAKPPNEKDEDPEIVGGQLAVIATTLFIIGVHFLGLTGAVADELREMRKLTQPRRKVGLTGKVRERLMQLIQPYNRSRLLLLPEGIEQEARAADPTDAKMAQRFMMAVAIEVLLVCPLRTKNLTGLRLDRHLKRLGPGGRSVTHIVIEGTETKNHDLVEWPVPPATAKLLEVWCRVWRPVMAGNGMANPYLFPALDTANSKSQAALAEGIKGLIRRELDLAVHPHLLRHFAAWRHLNRYPGQYEIVRRALGHGSIETTIGTYCGLEGEAAARLFHGGLEQDKTDPAPCWWTLQISSCGSEVP